MIKLSSDSNLIQGFVAAPVRCIWHIVACFIVSKKTFYPIRKDSFLFGDNLFCLLRENLFSYLFPFYLERILFSWERNSFSYERILLSLERVFSCGKAFYFLKRVFLSGIYKLFFLRWNRLWNKWAQKAAAKFSIG